MDKDLIISLIMIGPIAGAILFIVLYIYFRKSILYKIGLTVGFFAMFLAMTTTIVSSLGNIHYIWSIPLNIIALVLTFRYLKFTIKDPLTEINNVFKFLQVGDIESAQHLTRKSNDEFGSISIAANNLIDGFSVISTFAKEVGKGNLDTEIKLLGEKDAIGNSLIEMQKNLKIAKNTEEERKREEQKRFWINEGFAKFGDILRNNNEDNNELYFSIINNLVKYTGAIQGGLFLINDDDENDKYLELVSMYAYNRRKYISNRIELGETLVGQCVLEGESIFMTDIPHNYIQVTSGLGDANPSNLLLVPLKFNDQVFGVIELAAFNEIEDYIKTFIEKIGESIASTISTYKVNIKTKRLLEESKVQSEELASQEEEIRQNMEELQTTQEESSRRESELNNELKAVYASTLVVNLDLTGIIITINNNYSDLIGSSPTNMAGSKWQNYIQDDKDDNFDEILRTVQNGVAHKRDVILNNGIKIRETYSLINDASDLAFKILVIGMQID